MARPVKEIDSEQVEKLASLYCTLEEIGNFFGVNKSTISRRFATDIAKGRSRGRISIRRAQFEAAVNNKNSALLIWLGKQILGQTEKIEIDSENKPLPFKD